MATYSLEDFERIAAAIGKDDVDIFRHEKSFEDAARWYRLNSRAPKTPTRIAPSVMNKKMKQVAKDARKLLARLKVHDPREAPDGPGAIALLEYLASAENSTEDDVVQDVARIGRLLEILDSIDAAQELERLAEKATEDALQIGKLIVPEGHQGDDADNKWIADMMPVFKQITGKGPGVSVGAPGRRNEGIPGGPLIRFLEAAGKPLGLQHSPDSWCGRIRDLRTGGRRK